jgi:hypothetical protein
MGEQLANSDKVIAKKDDAWRPSLPSVQMLSPAIEVPARSGGCFRRTTAQSTITNLAEPFATSTVRFPSRFYRRCPPRPRPAPDH